MIYTNRRLHELSLLERSASLNHQQRIEIKNLLAAEIEARQDRMQQMIQAGDKDVVAYFDDLKLLYGRLREYCTLWERLAIDKYLKYMRVKLQG